MNILLYSNAFLPSIGGLERNTATLGRMLITVRREGNPPVIAEAVSVGTPVVGSDQPPMVESIGDARVTFPSGDVVALTAQIERMLADETYARVMPEGGLGSASDLQRSGVRFDVSSHLGRSRDLST